MIRIARRFLASIPKQETKLTSDIVQAQKYFNQGVTSWNKDEFEQSKLAFQKSFAILPTSDAYYNLANIYHQLGDTNGSIENWKKSLSERRADAHCNIANIMALVQKDFKGALEHYQKALEIDPEDGETHYNVAAVLDQDGQLEKAIEHYQIAVSFGIVQAENTLRNARARWDARAIAGNNDKK